MNKMKLIRDILFGTESEFIYWMNNLKDNKLKKEIIKHEKAHADMAKKLGDDIVYRLKIEEDYNKLEGRLLGCEVRIRLPKNLNHLREICLAPPNPSLHDKLMATFPTYILYYIKARKITQIFKKLNIKL